MAIGMALSLPIGIDAQPLVTGKTEVQSCEYIGRIDASSGYGKNYNWADKAKFRAMTKAERMGADHIVWVRTYPVGVFNGIAVGEAYHCND